MKLTYIDSFPEKLLFTFENATDCQKELIIVSELLAILCTAPGTSLYYISLYLGWELDDQHRNTNMNDKDHLVGQLTTQHLAHAIRYLQGDSTHSLRLLVQSVSPSIPEYVDLGS